MVEKIVLLLSTFCHITSWKIEHVCMARFIWHARQVEPMSTFIRISIHYYYYYYGTHQFGIAQAPIDMIIISDVYVDSYTHVCIE